MNRPFFGPGFVSMCLNVGLPGLGGGPSAVPWLAGGFEVSVEPVSALADGATDAAAADAAGDVEPSSTADDGWLAPQPASVRAISSRAVAPAREVIGDILTRRFKTAPCRYGAARR